MARSKLSALVRSLTLAASVGAPCLAAAADLLPPPPPPPPPPPIEVGGGWYLRGDVGASIYDRTKYVSYDDCHTCGGDKRAFGNAIGSGGFAGVGVGYQFTPFFRGDVTAEYRYSTGLRGSNYYNFGTDDWGNGLYGTEKTTGHFDSGVFLANAYFDLGTWYGITPFIGGGVGVALNNVSGFQTDSSFNSPVYGYSPYYDSCKCGGKGHPSFVYGPSYNPDGSTQYKSATGTTYYKDKSTTSFAWALHAGLAYNVTDAFKVELAYRYLNLGKVETGIGWSTCCGTLQSVKIKDIEAHDVKIGLRYYLGGVIAAPLPPLMPEPVPGPLVRKY
ncbi:outer membrane beta-barrel protein [Methylobacterium sp. NEAU 140]|uniref:outer membrane protein n=1 Tax=Methylobacterium sp. NEAU 140 TaxID=3064945 RepID=UPI0027371EBF|nr:outer membrane beta-barrel protein [Methylobacterium sp. NEAU 140]MDP4021652.1 outer membrane beta-barrel protein [Methylobacterium sp. NEAU 140]